VLTPTALVLVARCEATISTAEVASHREILPPFVEQLAAAAADSKSDEDGFQAEVCLAWVHWLLQQHKEAALALTRDPARVVARKSAYAEHWNQSVLVCAAKGAYVKGMDVSHWIGWS
jgi:hypothetical protein